ncbi:DNA-directed RNA polymerase subunit alpha [Chlamydiales bacterium SCGC AG-110-M15]|nr:DNA-directed RNA polymerase subunit alpha [Chlamydiales bacterium SCGC AG-110-M15]
MSVKYGKFEMPEQIKIEEGSSSATFARFIAEPFERGFGHTIGSSIRRMLLSSLESLAIVSMRIQDVPHEYMAVEGIVEDMTNIVLNLKGALLRKLPLVDENKPSRQPRIITAELDITQEKLDETGSYKVTLADLVPSGSFELVNPDLHIFTITKPMKKQVDLRVAFGRGYVPSERHEFEGRIADEIVIDSVFSPVRLVNYFVENTRVGQDTDFDRLVIEVTTDGRVTPEEALSFATQIGIRHFEVFNEIKSHDLVFEEAGAEHEDDRDEMLQKLAMRIEEIELSVRASNCLSGADIDTIAELVVTPESDMLKFRNFGKKSLNEIKAKLVEMGLSLGMDLNKYGITRENAKEYIKEFQTQLLS